MSKKSAYNIAVVGATGAVGEVMLGLLAERKQALKLGQVVALASPRSAGGKVNLGSRQLLVQDL